MGTAESPSSVNGGTRLSDGEKEKPEKKGFKEVGMGLQRSHGGGKAQVSL